MELDSLKQEWDKLHQDASVPLKNAGQLRQLIRQRSLRIFFKTRAKVVIEALGYLVILFVFITGLDAHLNRTYVNVLLVSILVLGMVNNFVVYRHMSLHANGSNLKQSLQLVLHKFRQQRKLVTYFTILYFTGISLFFLFRISYSTPKVLLLIGLFLMSVAIRTWFERRNWQRKISTLERCLTELDESV
jgi:hypothetical protein